MSVRPLLGLSVAEMARQSADTLNQIYARMQGSVLAPLAKEMERAMHKHRDLEPGDSVTGNPALWDDVQRLLPSDMRRVFRPNLEAHFWERPAVISVDDQRSCILRLTDGTLYRIHAQWLRRVTYDEVGA